MTNKRTAPWYTGFISKRMEAYIEEDQYAYECYGISTIPDWIMDQGKEIKAIYDALYRRVDDNL